MNLNPYCTMILSDVGAEVVNKGDLVLLSDMLAEKSHLGMLKKIRAGL